MHIAQHKASLQRSSWKYIRWAGRMENEVDREESRKRRKSIVPGVESVESRKPKERQRNARGKERVAGDARSTKKRKSATRDAKKDIKLPSARGSEGKGGGFKMRRNGPRAKRSAGEFGAHTAKVEPHLSLTDPIVPYSLLAANRLELVVSNLLVNPSGPSGPLKGPVRFQSEVSLWLPVLLAPECLVLRFLRVVQFEPISGEPSSDE